VRLTRYLMTVFGETIAVGISDQDLTFGRIKDPIINKNIDSTEL
jgi:hypothetical protein